MACGDGLEGLAESLGLGGLGVVDEGCQPATVPSHCTGLGF